MIPDKLPAQVLLHRTSSAYFDHVKHILEKWNIEVYEAAVRAEFRDHAILDSIPVAIALVTDDDFSGIDFLRSIMHSNNWTQRFMISSSNLPEIVERAINKAHINYILSLPPDAAKLALYLRKALRRYNSLTRPFAKYDALSNLTEELLLDNQRYREEANTDALTKLMNRRSFNNILQSIWQKYTSKNMKFSLAILDLDHFKNVNDQFGHAFGDRVLSAIGKVLLDNQRVGIDYSFRYGGEEFAVISLHIEAEEMRNYMERLLRIVRNTEVKNEQYTTKITFSSGIAHVTDAESPEQLIDFADKALYKAKASGRNCVLLHSPA